MQFKAIRVPRMRDKDGISSWSELPRGSTESRWIISDMIRFITVNKEKRSSTIWRFPEIGIAPNHIYFMETPI